MGSNLKFGTPRVIARHGEQAKQARLQQIARDLSFLWMLKPVEIWRAMKCSSGFGAAIQNRVGHTENSCHHRFGSFVPDVTVIFDNAGIDLDVPIRDVHISNPLYLPNIELSFRTV